MRSEREERETPNARGAGRSVQNGIQTLQREESGDERRDVLRGERDKVDRVPPLRRSGWKMTASMNSRLHFLTE
jgi:hypothetical protein